MHWPSVGFTPSLTATIIVCERPLSQALPQTLPTGLPAPAPGTSGVDVRVIDLHCHMLPNLDDGASDLATALAMARLAVADGIKSTACTPHIYPGLYDNDAARIRATVRAFQRHLEDEGIPLSVTDGADIQIVPGLVQSLKSGAYPTLNGSRSRTRHRCPLGQGPPPLLAELREIAARWVGAEEAERLVSGRPRSVIDNLDPATVPPPPGLAGATDRRAQAHHRRGWIARLWQGR